MLKKMRLTFRRRLSHWLSTWRNGWASLAHSTLLNSNSETQNLDGLYLRYYTVGFFLAALKENASRWPIVQTQTPSPPYPSGLLTLYRLKCTCQPSHCYSTSLLVSPYFKPYVLETDRKVQSPLGSADLLDRPLAKYSFLFSSILCCNNCRKGWQSKLKGT